VKTATTTSIRIQSPTRVDLAGGTLDCWPLHLFVGDCVTVNLSIDIWTGCELTPAAGREVTLEIRDLKFTKTYRDIDEVVQSEDKEILLVQKILEHYRPQLGFHLSTFSQSPVGGGLGGSSSLCISLIQALNRWQKIEMSTAEAVELAHNLEAKVIKNPTGTQDYYPALVPGLNIIHYTAAGRRVETVPFDSEVFRQNMMLIYTGKSHHSGINNWQVIKYVIEGDGATLAALKEIAKISEATAQVCREGQWSELPELFRSEFDSRIKLTSSFSSPEIEKLKKLAIAEGAQAVKICGAGGGGCVLIWAPASSHKGISEQCQRNGFQPLKVQPVRGLSPR
jgi:D-glycero-alpha-D-manno-heptose-7-phosphate kinase